MSASRIACIYRITRESLEIPVHEMENKNSNLKETIKELENALMSTPIFTSPITTM